MKIISSIESFILFIIVFMIVDKNCLSRAITLTWSHLTILIPWDFCRPYNKDLFSNWKFHSIYQSFQDIGWKLYIKTSHFSHHMESSDNVYTWETFISLIIRIVSATEIYWLNLTVLEIYIQKHILWPPCSIFSNSSNVCF